MTQILIVDAPIEYVFSPMHDYLLSITTSTLKNVQLKFEDLNKYKRSLTTKEDLIIHSLTLFSLLFGTSVGIGRRSKGSKPESYPIKMESRNRCASGPAHHTHKFVTFIQGFSYAGVSR